MTTASERYSRRRQQLQELLDSSTLLLISRPSDIAYLTTAPLMIAHEEREAFLVLSNNRAWLLEPGFSGRIDAADVAVCRGCHPTALHTHLRQILEQTRATTLVYEPSTLLGHEIEVLETVADEVRCTLTADATPLPQLRRFRAIKDTTEQQTISQAHQLTLSVLNTVLVTLAPGVTELAVRQQLEIELLRQGSERPAFPIIVAFGEHTALPHHLPSNRALREEEPVLIDMGATLNKYRSDLTRTVWYGDHPSAEFTRVYDAVTTAFDTGLASLVAGTTTARQLDTTVRQHLTELGFGREFVHSSGHGVGLDIHEPPSLSARCDWILEPGMVITLEPGVYLPGRFGVRWEETLVV